ncbi:hypothetical protein DB31_4377 [Hyalangium minutum]|uniref:Uncharacterized protein n=1 Tax=Hyalangium minutum TaxID=394096 RepID=A0A085W2M1_9BACT|nr:hypothetical protein DB31_4377 [Hyalangium minutum]
MGVNGRSSFEGSSADAVTAVRQRRAIFKAEVMESVLDGGTEHALALHDWLCRPVASSTQ